MLAIVGRDLHAGDATPATGVGISFHLVRRSDALGEVDGLIVIGRRDGRADVELVEDVLQLVPPPTRRLSSAEMCGGRMLLS